MSSIEKFVILFGLLAAMVQAPSPNATGDSVTKRTFDVISVRESPSDQPVVVREVANGVTYQAVTLAWLISRAFGIPEREILDGPSWVRSQRFDVNGRTEVDVKSRDEFSAMTQALRESRFELQVDRVRAERPVYELAVARKDRRLGKSLQKTSSACAPPGAFPASPIEVKDEKLTIVSRCGMSIIGGAGEVGQLLRVSGSRVTMLDFASALSKVLDRPVTDRTDLDGEFDFVVRPPTGLLSASPTTPGEPLSGALRFFAAVEDQLGLKLRPSRAQVDVVRIVAVQHPTAN